jgi:hypothetical protein
MGTTTFTGPITAGDILYTTGTTVGDDVANVGYVVMSQSAAFTQATNISSAGVYKTTIVIPAGSRIISVIATVTTAWSGAAKTINVGTDSTATQLAVAADNDFSTTVGNKSIIPGDNATRAGLWIDVGTSDVQIYTKSTNTGNGVGVLTVNYAQALNLTP